MNLPRIAFLFLAVALLPTKAALGQYDPEATQWLQRIYSATRKLSYTGVFVYHQGEQVETSRITSVATASGPVEKLEILDGTPTEIIRTPDQVVCYLPATMTMKIDRRAGRGAFPLILPDQVRELSESYVIRKGGVGRVAGYECQVIVLEPRDQLRYGYTLCADTATGMLLKTKTFNEKGDTLEMFAFTQLRIGGGIDREKVKSRFATKGREWNVANSHAEEANLAEAGWSVRTIPPGFRKITEMRRTIGAVPGVGHIVFSDGLAAVSVFIEPAGSRGASTQMGLSRQGAINFYARQLGGHRVTAMGEAPAESVRLIANAVEQRRP